MAFFHSYADGEEAMHFKVGCITTIVVFVIILIIGCISFWVKPDKGIQAKEQEKYCGDTTSPSTYSERIYFDSSSSMLIIDHRYDNGGTIQRYKADSLGEYHLCDEGMYH